MNRDDGELTKEVVKAQQERCHHGDFFAQTSRDMAELSVIMDDLSLSTEKLKSKLVNSIRSCAFEFLIEKAKTHSKVNHHIYQDCDGAKQYSDQRFTPDLV